MKEVFKGIFVKVGTIVVIVGVLIIGGKYVFDTYINKPVLDEKTTDVAEILQEKIENSAELNTAEYLCTAKDDFENSKSFKGWNIPLTTKHFTVSYDGVVKAGIKDLSKAKVKKQGKTDIVITVPAIEITYYKVDPDTVQVYDESHNVLNQITVQDVADSQVSLEDKMVERAKEYGLLDSAKENAEMILETMFCGTPGMEDYNVSIKFEE